MKPRALTAAFAATAVAIVVILVLWVYPGILATHPNCPSHTTYAGRPYCSEITPLQQWCPNGGVNCPAFPPPGFTFQAVLFRLALVNASGGPVVDGWTTESNNTAFQFSLRGNSVGLPSAWTSPDHEVLVLWLPPFATAGQNGVLYANVTCGVSLAIDNAT